MLLPSDVARLVLGYLQEEGMSNTSRAFIHESPNLKEYADHTTGDGTIPACVFSVFGKGLTTILNEYVSAKRKESCSEVPAVMTSLWKKLDFTLNQIKSMQNSPAISASQRTRSRVGLANMAGQRALTIASAGSVLCSPVADPCSIVSPAHASHSMLGHSTPVSFTSPHSRALLGSATHLQIHDGTRLINPPRDSPVQILVSEHRVNPGPMSPGRRKCPRDTPRKRSGAQSGSSGPGRPPVAVSNLDEEPQHEEVVDENFPQLVIQNARDKILGDRSLQEKLAENINKILANEPTPQASKAPASTVEADPSIDEILGLQGEIHMSDDAIHDILEQTESDPAFQALFDLFEYNKTKFPDGESGDGNISTSPEETDTAGPPSTVGQLLSEDLGTTQRDADASDATPSTAKTRAAQERKSRKATAPLLIKKIVVGSGRKASRIENSTARLLVSNAEHQGVSSGALNRKEKVSLFNSSVGATPMDIDEPLNTPPPSSDSMAAQEALEPASSFPTSTALSGSTTVPSSRSTAAAEEASASNGNRNQKSKLAQRSKETVQPVPLSLVQVEPIDIPTAAADQPHVSVPSSGGETQPMSVLSVTPEFASSTLTGTTVTAALILPSSAATAAPFAATPATPTSASTSATLTAIPASSTSTSPASSVSACIPVTAASDPLTTNDTSPSKAAGDSSNIVSLKIIISDNQDADSAADTALNQAISSISGDKIPTIYLSSPAKSPRCPGTPKANMDETAQAVSGLQSYEAQANPLGTKAGVVVSSPLTGTSQAKQNYIIQLPLDATNTALQGTTASYFLVTEHPTPDAQARQMLVPAGVPKGPPLPTSSQYGVTTRTPSHGCSTGSPLLLPSPIKPMILPISLMGQNTLSKVQMVSNQLVAIPNPIPVQRSEVVKPKPPILAVKQPTTSGNFQINSQQSSLPAQGAEKTLAGKVIQTLSAENTGQQNLLKGLSPSHKRILCFESSAEVQQQTSKTTRNATPPAANMSTSRSITQAEKDASQKSPRTKPAILVGNKPKRRVQTVRCLVEPQTGAGLVKETEKSTTPRQQHKEPIKKNSYKQDPSQESDAASSSSVDASQPESLKKSELRKRSKSIDRKPNHKGNDEVKLKDSHSSKPLPSDSELKSGSIKDKDESSRKEHADKAPAKSREGHTEKRTPSQEMPNMTANKENELKGSLQEQSTPSSSAPKDFSPPTVTTATSNPQSKPAIALLKTSSLAKQAAEMLQDIQGLNSPSTPIKRPAVSGSDLPPPRTPGTGHNQEESVECPKASSRQKKGKDGEATPKRIVPQNTPDVPGCSPASEAGSENSINMAAHTLIILSRAAIARTGTPLKDSLRQEGIGEKSSTCSKNAKKRKLSSPTTSPPKKDSKQSPDKKKDRERKKIVDCFPHDLDVDKFLSSLHYDE